MAIKEVDSMEDLKITVTLRDGTVIGPADTTDSPFGEAERVVAVWVDGTICVYPLDTVAKVEMHFGS